MKTLIVIFSLFPCLMLSALDVSKPVIDEYQLNGYEKANFVNILLDPGSAITDFYCITDDGQVLKVENMGEDPEVTEVFSFPGEITEAITYDSTHYLSLSNELETMLIGTRDFKSIDTLYQRQGYKITDFRITDSIFFLLMNNGTDGFTAYKSIDVMSWTKTPIPDIKYNRLAVMGDQILLFKYLKGRLFYVSNDIGKNWQQEDFLFVDQQETADIKVRDTLYFMFGKGDNFGNATFIYNNSLNLINGAFGPTKQNTILDIAIHKGFNILNNRNNYQIGFSEEEGEGAIFNKFIGEGGDGFRKIYNYSSSLNKIKSNPRNGNMEFVAVGNDGIILIVNKGASPVIEEQNSIQSGSSFSISPNIITGNSPVIIHSKTIVEKAELIDLTGRKIMQKSSINKYEFYLHLPQLSSGMYFIKIGTETKKLLVR